MKKYLISTENIYTGKRKTFTIALFGKIEMLHRSLFKRGWVINRYYEI